MSNDDLRIKAKTHSTVENTPVKPEDKTGEVKPAEILVGEELAQTPVSTSDVELDKTAEKRAENKKAEEDAAFADMDSIIAEITGEQIEAEGEKIIEESQNLELTSTAQALHDATQKGFQGITSYGNLGSQFKSSEAFIPNLQEVADLKEAGEVLADINTSEAQKRAAIALLKRIAPNSDIANYYSQILTLGKAKMNEQASQTVESKQKNNDSVKDNYQDVLDSEGIVSYALNGAICLVGGTTRGDVADSIKDEDAKISVLRAAANNKDIRTFMKLYKDFTGVKFNVEKFQVLAKKEEEYQKAIAIKQGVALAKALEKNPYGVQIMRVMQTETELGERNYNFDMAKADKPSPLQQALLTQFGGNQLLAALWINGNIENKNLAGKSQKEIYDSLVKEFVNNQNKMANEFFKDKSFENILSDYENAIHDAYGLNIPQIKLDNYIAAQEIAHSVLKAAIMFAMYTITGGFGAIVESVAVGATMGIYEAIETGTDADKLSEEDIKNAFTTGIKMGLYNLAFYGASSARMISKGKIASLLNKYGVESSKLARSLSIGVGAATMMAEDYMIAKLFNDDIDFRTELLVCFGYSIIDAKFISEKMAGPLDFADLSAILQKMPKKLIKTYDQSSALKITQATLLEAKDSLQHQKTNNK